MPFIQKTLIYCALNMNRNFNQGRSRNRKIQMNLSEISSSSKEVANENEGNSSKRTPAKNSLVGSHKKNTFVKVCHETTSKKYFLRNVSLLI